MDLEADRVVQAGRAPDRWPEATITRLSVVLGEALENDPLMELVARDPDRRARIAPWLYGRTLRYGLRYGKVDLAEAGDGVAVWLPPDHPAMTLGRMLRVGFLAAPFKVGLGGLLRLGRYRRVKQALRKSALRVPHWYLLVIGVASSARGQGVGRTLLRTTLSRADERGDPCYLETTLESNLAFFEKGGFSVRGEDRVPDSDVRVWAMVREPSS